LWASATRSRAAGPLRRGRACRSTIARAPILCHGYLTHEIAARYPGANFIMAHASSAPAQMLRPAELPNTFADMSATSMLAGTLELMCERIGPKRILYASDLPASDVGQRLGMVMAVKISEAARELILGHNMQRLLDEVRQAAASQRQPLDWRPRMSYRWQEITMNAQFAPRDGAGALTLNGTMYLLGGWNPRDKVNFPRVCNSEVWSSVDGLTWTEIQPQAPWEGRHAACYVVYRGHMWIIGGDCNQGHYQGDIWCSADGVEWELVRKEVPWGPRVLHCAVVLRDRLWVYGGQTVPSFASAPERFYQDIWCSEDGVDWTQVTDAVPWPSRNLTGMGLAFGDRLWVLGGGTYETPERPDRVFYNDVWSSADGVRWEQHLEHAAWEPRQFHDGAVWDEKLWVMEGGQRDCGNRNDVWYSADGVAWTELPDTPWAPRHAASLFVHDDALWMVTGNNLESDVWKLVREQ